MALQWENLPYGCRAFGSRTSFLEIQKWIKILTRTNSGLDFLLILGGTRTAEIDGISAAGSTSVSRRFTAIADAELLLYGPSKEKRWPLPALPAGVSPALISYVANRWLGLYPFVLAVGLSKQPDFSHLRFDLPSNGPADCLTTGNAMCLERVQTLWQKGISMGRRLSKPLFLTECVPGGTTTAQAVLTGLGLSVGDLISGSIRNPPTSLKRQIVQRGLISSGLGVNPLPKQLLAAVGDPFQAAAVGILLGAREVGQKVLLGGGSQMLAVLALALAELKPFQRSRFVEGIALGTTSWLIEESISSPEETKESSSLLSLIGLIEKHFDIKMIGFASGLRFNNSVCRVLQDYEKGYVKEGVGAGAFAFLAQLNGATCDDLVKACEEAVDDLVEGSCL